MAKYSVESDDPVRMDTPKRSEEPTTEGADNDEDVSPDSDRARETEDNGRNGDATTEYENQTEARRRVESELLNETLDLDRETGRLKAIGEPTRFTVLYLLAAEGKLHSGELADLLDRQQNDLYHHLNELEDAGLVGKRRADDGGRIYELSPLAERMVEPLFDAIRNRAEAV